mmetsp:Transcript_46359/g.86992  ORF Transcript_46359/g.86992 Transcript_46359/m.86992 type:complete len:278 (+) Transcript_46359:1691-2524(+)
MCAVPPCVSSARRRFIVLASWNRAESIISSKDTSLDIGNTTMTSSSPAAESPLDAVRPGTCSALRPQSARLRTRPSSLAHCSKAIGAVTSVSDFSDGSSIFQTFVNSSQAALMAASASRTGAAASAALELPPPVVLAGFASQVRRQRQSTAASATSGLGCTASGHSKAHRAPAWLPKAGCSALRTAQQPLARACCTSSALGCASMALRSCCTTFRGRAARLPCGAPLLLLLAECLSCFVPGSAAVSAHTPRAAAATSNGVLQARAVDNPANTASSAR